MYSFDPVTGALVPFTVTWYKAPIGSTPLGIRHQYASANWTKPTPYPEQIGEVLSAARPWSNGRTPPGVLGTNHCGTQWTGELFRLSVPEPSNAYDQPACCNHVVECQPRSTAVVALDQTDGSGLVNMHVISALGWWLQSTADPTYAFLALATIGTCHGSPRHLRLQVVDTATRSVVYAECAVLDINLATHLSHWYVPLASPVSAGDVIVLRA